MGMEVKVCDFWVSWYLDKSEASAWRIEQESHWQVQVIFKRKQKGDVQGFAVNCVISSPKFRQAGGDHKFSTSVRHCEGRMQYVVLLDILASQQ